MSTTEKIGSKAFSSEPEQTLFNEMEGKTLRNPISSSPALKLKNEVPTLLRIKRKLVPEKEENSEKILNFCVLKKMKFSEENTRVFAFFKTVGRNYDQYSPSAQSDLPEINPIVEGSALPDEALVPPLDGSASARQSHRLPVKKLFRQQSSMSQVKQVLSSKMIQKAKETRYRLRDEKRKQQIIQDGIIYNVLDIEKDDGTDPLTRSLEAMTQDFLKLNHPEIISQKSSDDEDALYDLYIYKHDALLKDVLNSGLVGTLEMDDDTLYLDDEPSASDIGSDSDSNAEDYYKNDYPEEELSEEEVRYPRYYASSHEGSDSESDFIF